MRVSFIGGGNMATAMLSGMLRHGFQPEEIYVVDPNLEKRLTLANQYGVEVGEPTAPLPLSDMVVLAVKPQQIANVLAQIGPQLQNSLVMSIAASVGIATLQTLCGGMPRIIRVMPNTPSLISAGVSGVFASPLVTDTDKLLAQRVLEAIGKVIWVEEESTLDPIAAVSGCGPAYVFSYLIAMLDAAQNQGFDPITARELVYATFSGAMKLAESSFESVYTLRERVMSKGGVTERGVAVLEQKGLSPIINEAVQAARERCQELEQVLLESFQIKKGN